MKINQDNFPFIDTITLSTWYGIIYVKWLVLL